MCRAKEWCKEFKAVSEAPRGDARHASAIPGANGDDVIVRTAIKGQRALPAAPAAPAKADKAAAKPAAKK